MQTVWLWMRCWVTLRLTQIKFVWHSDNIFNNFEQHWRTLKIEAEEKFSRRQFIWAAKLHWGCLQTFLWWENILKLLLLHQITYAKTIHSNRLVETIRMNGLSIVMLKKCQSYHSYSIYTLVLFDNEIIQALIVILYYSNDRLSVRKLLTHFIRDTGISVCI